MNVVIVLNWCAAKETIECVNSILGGCPDIDLVCVVDNCSPDGSMDVLTEWLQSKRNDTNSIMLVKNSENSGYAGGNNFGLRKVLERFHSVENFWLFNNDAYVKEDAFGPLLDVLAEDSKAICGSVVLSSKDDTLECFGGGLLYPLLGKARLLGKGKSLSGLGAIGLPDYIMGCSMAFSRKLLDEVGFMDESYFMYSEEIDWQFRAREKGFYIAVADNSIIYHHGSMSSGGRGAFYHFYRNRAAIMFNKKFYGARFALLSAAILSLITLSQELIHPSVALAGIRGAFAGLKENFRHES
tara:strand:+ start:6413 stop:7306 length:894 start_codon:yes stop_codon:yes gene_type:complete